MNSKIIILTIVLIGIIIVGTAGALYTGIWNPTWNPFQPSPEIILGKMIRAMDGVKTFREDTDIGIEIKNTPGLAELGMGEVMDVSVSFTYQLDVDIVDSFPNEAVGDFDMSVSMNGMSFSLDGEIVSKERGEIFYFKLTTIPLIAQPFLEMLGLDLKDQWVKIDPIEMTPEEGREALQEKFQRIDKVVEEIMELLKDRTGELLYVKEDFPETQINGKQAYHYLVGLDKKEAKKFISDVIEIAEKEILEMIEKETGEEITEQKLEEFRKGVNEFMAGLDKFFEATGEIILGEIWIGKQDYLLYRVLMEKEIDIEDIKELNRIIREIIPGAEGLPEETIRGMEEVIISIKLESNYSNFNQPVEIKAPEQYKTLDQLIPGTLEIPEIPGM